jgi:hypothetical protein
MTSDGISADDWDRVHGLALDVVNTDDGDESDASTERLLAYLDDLEAKYGPLPSILATRADYVSEPRNSEMLLEQAYETACESGDHRNMLYIASSLAELQIESFGDVPQAQRWLTAMQEALRRGGGESDIREYEELCEALARLRSRQAETDDR